MVITEVISFFNELDLLEAHLEESQCWADRIVIIESPVTFTSLQKPLLFSEHRERFERFDVEVLITEPDVFETIPTNYPKQEAHQWRLARARNRNLNRMHHWDEVSRGTDYIYFNDVDEFISRDHFSVLENYLKPLDMHYGSVKTRVFNFWVNARGGIQSQHRICRSDMNRITSQKGTPRFDTAVEIGWHFTNCMSIDDIHLKALGMSCHMNRPVDQVPSIPEMQDKLLNFCDPLTGSSIRNHIYEIMPRHTRDWAPRFINENPGLYPWLDPGAVPTIETDWKL